MTLFYAKKISYKLSLDESKHCLRSLRKKVNDYILLTEGDGIIYRAKIKDIENHIIIYNDLEIIEKKEQKIKIHIVIAPPKNRTRFEWFLEKATEVGVDTISPLICEHSERIKINKERCEKILISAMKQSKNSILPKINTPITFNDLVKKNLKNTYIAHCYEEKKRNLKDVLLNSKKMKQITLFIGPEGDFSKKELNFAIKMGITPIKLGNNRLRTETAGIVGCSIINLLA